MIIVIVVFCVLLFYMCFNWPTFNAGSLQKVRFVVCDFIVWTTSKRRKPEPMFAFEYESNRADKLGITSLPEARHRESPRQLSEDINAIDSVEFFGISNDGRVLFVRIVRRRDRCSEVTVHLALNSGVEYELPVHPDCRVYNTDGGTFSAAGLSFELLEPLRRWRISFNGNLRKGTRKKWTDPQGEMVPVKFNFLWSPINDYVGFPNDFGTDVLSRNLFNRSQTFRQMLRNPYQLFSEESHEHFGQIKGTLTTEGQEEVTLLLRGVKIRRHGVDDWSALTSRTSITGVTEHGCCFRLFSEEMQKQLSRQYGYVTPPCNTVIRHLNPRDIGITNAAEENNFYMKVKAGEREYQLQVEWSRLQLSMQLGENRDFRNDIRIIRFSLNGKFGYGIVETIRRHSVDEIRFVDSAPNQISVPHPVEPVIEDDLSKKYVIALDEIECRSSEIVGGKGASLAQMVTLATGSEHPEFNVPRGLCLSILAFREHLSENPLLSMAIKRLQDVAWKRINAPLPDECHKVVGYFHDTTLSNHIRGELDSVLKLVFGNRYHGTEFAVRSSGIGEDGEDLSAAGQHETFLGVKAFDKLCDAVIKCWASQFSHRSVEYKRQNGQLLNLGMGVVVQEMIAPEVAGVLFTHHPTTGNQDHMMISANYGLAETVVAGTVEPDTMVLERNFNEQLRIVEKRIGTKSIRVTTSGSGDGLTTSTFSPEVASKFCLSDETAFRLARIAMHLEKCSGSARDLEWAEQQGNIYLLQSRPVTTGNGFSTYEVLHEFDSHSRTDNEYYSTANLGEIMPGSKSTLASTTTTRAIRIAYMDTSTWKRARLRYDPTVDDVFADFYGHTFYNRMLEKMWNTSEDKGSVAKCSEISIHGRILDDDDDDKHLQRIALERADDPPLRARTMLPLHMIKGMLFGNRIAREGLAKYSKYPIPGARMTRVVECYQDIDAHLCDIARAAKNHSCVSYGSMSWNLVVLQLLTKDENLYSDFATIVCNTKTESGNVPNSISMLGSAIAADIDVDSFCTMSPKDALEWIQLNRNKSGTMFARFLERHGHRGYKELDVYATSWDMEPEKLILILQGMLKSQMTEKKLPKEIAIDEAIENMQATVSPMKKYILAWALKHCRKGVNNREMTKSMLVKVADGFRKGYRHLAHLMVREGMLPEEELIFFLTHEEIAEHIESRSAKLLRRAKQRRRLYHYKNRLQFPQMITGTPKPLEDPEERDSLTDQQMGITGVPVSHGKVKGPAKVLRNFDDVHTIQPGDILITRNTDIGWSPYFPMLAGVVTELGGLISHGAVIAREFGLPCMVGAKNATRYFKSGENVLLDTTKGTIVKITEP